MDLEFKDEEWRVLSTEKETPESRWFPGIKRETITPEMIQKRGEFLKDKHLDESPMDMIVIDWIDKPAVMKESK